jgi:hypothetical protein
MSSLVKLMSKCDAAAEYCTIVLFHKSADKGANDARWDVTAVDAEGGRDVFVA